jgi:hypothetical protein
MSVVVIYDPADAVVANRVTNVTMSAHTPAWGGIDNVLINPGMSGVAGVDRKYWKADVGANAVIEMTAEEKAAVDDVQAAADLARSYELLIRRRMMQIAIDSLIASGELPADHTLPDGDPF